VEKFWSAVIAEIRPPRSQAVTIFAAPADSAVLVANQVLVRCPSAL
jgi:hypothetical protein